MGSGRHSRSSASGNLGGTADDTEPRTRRRRRVEITGDLVVLALFVLGGLAEHRSGFTVGAFLRNVLPFGGAWLGWSWVFGCYRQAEVGTRIRALVSTWLVAVPTGVGVRAFLLGRSLDGTQARFLLVAMATTGAMLALWRGVVAGLGKFLAETVDKGEGGTGRNGKRSSQRIVEA